MLNIEDMTMEFKSKLKRILLRWNKGIIIDRLSEINFDVQNGTINSAYPCVIENSICNFDEVNEGCHISEARTYGKVRLGRFVSISGPGTVIKSLGEKIDIGSFSSIGQNVCVVDFNHRYNRLSSSFVNFKLFNSHFEKDIETKGSTIIEEDVWIGSNTVILPGVTIGRGAVIGAGSIVATDVPRYTIAAGNPAKNIRKRFSDEAIQFIERTGWWSWSIDKIKEHQDLFLYDLNGPQLRCAVEFVRENKV